MSKECPRCKTTNYSSAAICPRCGYAFSDGSYNVGENVADIKTQKKTIDKTAKILVSIIAVIICLILFLIIFYAVNNSGKSKETDSNTANGSGGINAVTEHLGGEISSGTTNNVISGWQEQQTMDWGTYIPVEEIKLNTNKIELEIGQSVQLQATILPESATNRDLYWSSSDNGVVEVVNGTVTAISKGEAKIYVMGENDKYAVCDVIVKELVEPAMLYDYGNFVVTANPSLNLRMGPGTEYDDIGSIKKNEIVRVYAYEDDTTGNKWAFVEYKGKRGWVFNNFLDLAPKN